MSISAEGALRAVEAWVEWQSEEPGVGARGYAPGSRASDRASDDPQLAWVILQVDCALAANPRLVPIVERLYYGRGILSRTVAYRRRGELLAAVARSMERDPLYDVLSIADAAIQQVRRSRIPQFSGSLSQ